MATTTEHRSSLLKIVSQPQVKSLLQDAERRIAAEEGVSFGSVGVESHF